MGVTPMRARGCVRFSLGVYNTGEEVDYVLEVLPPIIAKLRASSPAPRPEKLHKAEKDH